MAENKSFLGSVMDGVTGAVKGAIGLGVIGAAAGVLIGTGLGAFGALGLVGMGAGAIAGTATGIVTGINIGATLGAITGIVKSRETSAPHAQDITNLANIAFAQGVATARSQGVSTTALNQVQEAGNKFRDTEDARRALAAAGQTRG